MKKLPKSLTTITRFSKTVALILFIALPFIGFYLGIKYQKAITPTEISDPTANWQTYSDSSLSFKYPSQVSLGKLGGFNVFYIENNKNQMVVLSSSEPGNILYSLQPKNLDQILAEECPNKQLCSNPVPGPIPGSLQFDYLDREDPATGTILKNGNVFYQIDISYLVSNVFDQKTGHYVNPNNTVDPTIREIYNQILSTFKFTN